MPPLFLTEEWIESVNAQLPALPNALYRKFIAAYGLPRYDAALLTESKEVATWFEALCAKTAQYKAAADTRASSSLRLTVLLPQCCAVGQKPCGLGQK